MIDIAVDDSRSMHFELIVQHNFTKEVLLNESINSNKESRDLFYLFFLPCGVYVDNYELSLWKSFKNFDYVSLYFDKEEVLCESLCEDHDDPKISFAIEILGLYASSLPLVNFSIPLHKQYQVIHNHMFPFVNYSISSPLVFARNTRDFPTSNSRKVTKYFKRSFLGNLGNYKLSPWEVPNINSSEYRLVNYGQMKILTLTFPIGDAIHANICLLVNSSIYIIISLIILFFLSKNK